MWWFLYEALLIILHVPFVTWISYPISRNFLIHIRQNVPRNNTLWSIISHKKITWDMEETYIKILYNLSKANYFINNSFILNKSFWQETVRNFKNSKFAKFTGNILKKQKIYLMLNFGNYISANFKNLLVLEFANLLMSKAFLNIRKTFPSG